MRTIDMAAGTAVFLTALLASAPARAAEPAAPPPPTQAPIVFFDIAAPELEKQSDFYRVIFGWDVKPGGQVTVPVASPLAGFLRVESAKNGPVAERVIYIGVADITKTLTHIEAHGGTVDFPRTVVPGVVILALFRDPAGNRTGLVEIDSSGKPIVPPAR